MNLLDTIAQAATFLDYTHLTCEETTQQYQIDLECNTREEAEQGFIECFNAYCELSHVHGLDDDSILSLNHNYQLESIDYVAEFIALDNQLHNRKV